MQNESDNAYNRLLEQYGSAPPALLELVETVVRESGDLESFDARAWLADWLERPVGALGGPKPVTHLQTAEGLEGIA